MGMGPSTQSTQTGNNDIIRYELFVNFCQQHVSSCRDRVMPYFAAHDSYKIPHTHLVIKLLIRQCCTSRDFYSQIQCFHSFLDRSLFDRDKLCYFPCFKALLLEKSQTFFINLQTWPTVTVTATALIDNTQLQRDSVQRSAQKLERTLKYSQ